MKQSVIHTTLGLIALATMSLAASHAQANHDTPQRFDTPYGHNWEEREHDRPRYSQQDDNFIAEIHARQAKQQDRIRQGKHEGSLTQREFRTLMSEQQRIGSMKRDFLADGFLSPFEFRKLDRALDVAGRHIRTEKRDHDVRTSYHENRHRYYR